MPQAQQPEALRLADALAYCESSVAAQAARELRSLHAQLEAAPAATPPAPTPTYLPLLVRDIARELGITSPEACATLKPLGNFSVNSAVTAEMVAKLREQHPATQAQDVQRDAGSEWEEIDSLPNCDDLIWLYCQDTNTIDGPVVPRPSFVDEWSHWAYAEAPSTAAIDAAIAASAEQGEA